MPVIFIVSYQNGTHWIKPVGLILLLLVQGAAAATLSVTSAPSASFTATPAGTTPPVMVTFQDRSIGQVDRWHWKFGDKATGNRWGGSTLQVNAGDPPCTQVPGVNSLPGQSAPPTDPNRERLSWDLNGNRATYFNEVVLFFNKMDRISEN